MPPVSAYDPDAVIQLFDGIVEAVGQRLRTVDARPLSGARPGQYVVDLHADAVVVDRLIGAGLGVLSEESGLHHTDSPVTVIVDPLDGSTNASRGVPWFATALCAVDAHGPWVAVVGDHASGRRYRAVRDRGATLDGAVIHPSNVQRLDEAIVGLSGLPPRHLGWQQFRAFGAAALDLCLVAQGVLDGYMDCSIDAHGVWDYAASVLICAEVGVPVVDVHDRDLVVLDPDIRRTPIAAASPQLLESMVSARRSFT